MSGTINGTLTLFNDGGVDLTPEYTPSQVRGDEGENIQACPIAAVLQMSTPRCATMMFDGTRRYCPYFIAAVEHVNGTRRVDIGDKAMFMVGQSTSTTRLDVLCNCARRNRPAGC